MSPSRELARRGKGVRASDADRELCARVAVRTHAVAFTAVNGGLAGIWAATGEGVYWPGPVLAVWSVALAGHVMARRAAKNVQRRLPKMR